MENEKQTESKSSEKLWHNLIPDVSESTTNGINCNDMMKHILFITMKTGTKVIVTAEGQLPYALPLTTVYRKQFDRMITPIKMYIHYHHRMPLVLIRLEMSTVYDH